MNPLIVLIAAVPVIYFIISTSILCYFRRQLREESLLTWVQFFLLSPIVGLLAIAHEIACWRWERRGYKGRPWI